MELREKLCHCQWKQGCWGILSNINTYVPAKELVTGLTICLTEVTKEVTFLFNTKHSNIKKLYVRNRCALFKSSPDKCNFSSIVPNNKMLMCFIAFCVLERDNYTHSQRTQCQLWQVLVKMETKCQMLLLQCQKSLINLSSSCIILQKNLEQKKK